jgi:hypothetical protein
MATATDKPLSGNHDPGDSTVRVRRSHPRLLLGWAILLWGLAATATADLAIVLTPTPLGGGVLQYDVAISNTGPFDVVIVTLTDAPMGDGLIDPSLTAPAGFAALYDSFLGLIDFFEDTDLFAVGTTHNGFAFQSTASPATNFTSFEAFDVDGGFIAGAITVVPEPAGIVLALSALAVLAIVRGRRRGEGQRSSQRMPTNGGVVMNQSQPRIPRMAVAAAVVIGVALPLAAAPPVWAASHSDAPLIKQDPQTNIIDVYAFIGTRYDDPDQWVLNVVVGVCPFSDPGDGVIYERFADDALYSIHITDPATGATVDRYDFRFSTVTGGLKNPNTILSYGLGTQAGAILDIGDARQNYTQTYTVSKNGAVVASGLPVPPPNVGLRTTPGYNDPATGKAISGATTEAELDPLTRQAVQDLPGGEAVWAGPREDGFYADTPGIFDLLDPRIIADQDGNPATGGLGQDGGGVDGFQGFNTLSYALQIPVESLTPGTYPDPIFGSSATGVGVYASVSRQRLTLRRTNGAPVNSGAWIQVNRMGNPLFNEVLVALQDKDKYNRTSPTDDAQFATYALNPELAFLINFVLFGDTTGMSPLPTTDRTDLASFFIPDVLRVDTTTPPVLLPGQAGFSRLGILGSDITSGAGGPRSGGWPNGRRIGDDVVDIALTALSRFTVDIGDNVNANDQVYNQVFPYLATPHAGPTVTQRQDP